MAHLLDFSKGFAAIALAEHTESAWHGYGNRVGADVPVEQWPAKAGADYIVAGRNLFYAGIPTTEGKGRPVQVPDRKALIRLDTGAYLSTVGHEYAIVQPIELFDFQRQVIDAVGAKMDTAGVLRGGKTIWTLSKVEKSFRIQGQDLVDVYVLASTTYDGTQASRFQYVTTRVVCDNTLQIAISGSKYGYVSVNHSSKLDVAAVAAKLIEGEDDISRFVDAASGLAEIFPTNEQIVEFITRVIPDAFRQKDGKIEISQPAGKVLALLGRGKGADLKSANGTAWGLVNAVTEYVDHHQRSKDQGSRLASAWFGQGAQRKETALEVAKALFLNKEAA